MTIPTPTTTTFQYMLNGSRAVLTNPSVSTFEEYERDDLGWAVIYVAIGAAIVAVLSVIGFSINPAAGAGLPPEFRPTLFGALSSNIAGTLIGYFIWLGLVYGIGRLFGGTGKFGELAFDVSLYWAPLAIVSALIGVVPIPVLSGLAALAAFVYNVYLTYLSVQSGMNLPRDKALYTILIPMAVFFLLICGLAVLIFGLVAAVNGGAQPR